MKTLHPSLLLAMGLTILASSTSAQTVIAVDGTYDGNQAPVMTGVLVDTTSDFSVTFWFNDTTGGDEAFFSLTTDGVEGSQGFGARLDETSGGSGIFFPEVNADATALDVQNTTSAQFADGTDHQIVVTYDATAQKAALYADGVLLGESSGGVNLFAAPTTREVIVFERTGDDSKLPFSGTFSDVAVYDSLLSLADVQTLYAGGFGTVSLTAPLTWAGFTADENGQVDTGDWLGWVYVSAAPWIWSHSVQTWMYFPESSISESGAWTFVLR